MSTLNSRIINPLLEKDFNPGIYKGADINLSNVNPEDIDILAANLSVLKQFVIDVKQDKEAQARKLLESLIEQSGEFKSVDELLSALGNAPAPAQQTKTAKPNGNKVYEVTLFDKDSDEHRRYNVINKVLPKGLLNDPVYQAIIKKNKELVDVDLFLRAYSTDYANQYPINAKWKKETFHLNQKGRLNAQSAKYFEEYKKEYPNGDEKDFKEHVTKEYKN
ncbi:hypothetical protein ACRFZU_000505 [Escherichia coli]|uniref:hypothetical protein n=1 Tax=Enterobacter hormaechei TaxID=158836 RepID=UPI0006683FDD|nr:hypothetical protein [Enterobacter hormaechei]HCI6795740.1 hypothetical protein [Klebsiella quasipneumoniae subsp. quasipneumoniae]HDR2892893.1 hypothetical protein [Enterobacter asburiae]